MVYSPHPITVDGVSLDAYCWGVEAKTRAWPASRAGDLAIPGIDGLVPTLNDDLDAGVLTLTMWLIGVDPTGSLPGTVAGMAQARANLDSLVHLFIGRRNALLDVREVVDSVGTTRQAWCKVVDQIVPEMKPGGLGRFTVVLSIPDGMWQDPATTDWSQASAVSGTSYEVTSLRGGTAPVNDAVLLVTGPVNTPRLSDPSTGAYVQLNQNLAASNFWRVNCGTWATRYGTGLTLASTDTTGTDGQASTVFGAGNARFLRLQPSLTLSTLTAETVRRTNLSPNPEPLTTTDYLASQSGGVPTIVAAPWDATRTAARSASGQSNANLVTNGTFEVDLTGWTEVDASSIATMAQGTDQFRTGAASLKLSYTGGGAGQAATAQYTVAGLTVGGSYAITAWVRADSTGPNPIIRLVTSGATSSTTNVSVNTWTLRTLTFTATATSHAFTVGNFAVTAAGQNVWVDDVSLVRNASVTYVFSARAAPAFLTGDVITVRAKVKVSNPNRGFVMSVHQRTPNLYHINPSPGSVLGAFVASNSNQTGWVELSLTGTLPADVPAGQLDVTVLTNTIAGAYAYIEDGETLTVGDILIEKTTTGPYFDGDSQDAVLSHRWQGTVAGSASDEYIPAVSGPGIRKVNLVLTGTGFTSATAVAVRARRKYLQ